MNPFSPQGGDSNARLTRSSLASEFGSAPMLWAQSHRYIVREVFFAQITSTPPDGIADFDAKDERYWVKRSAPKEDRKPSDYLEFELDDFGKTGIRDPIIPATNLAELPPQKDDKTAAPAGGPHILPMNTVVLVFAMVARSSPLKKFYVFVQPIPQFVRLKPKSTTWSDSTVLGGSKYRCRIWAPTANAADISLTTTSSEADFGTEGTVDVLGINRREMGTTNKKLDFSGSFLPTSFDARFEQVIQAGTYKGIAVYSFDGIQNEAC